MGHGRNSDSSRDPGHGDGVYLVKMFDNPPLYLPRLLEFLLLFPLNIVTGLT